MIHNLFRINASGADQFVNPWSGVRSLTGVGSSAPFNFYTFRTIPLHGATIARDSASGGSTAVIADFVNGTEGGTSIGTVTLADPDTSVLTDFTGTWSDSVGVANTQGHHVDFSITGSPTGAENSICYVYQDAALPSLTWTGFGSRTVNLLSGTPAATDRFMTAGMQTTVQTVENRAQVIWPISGTFQYVHGVYLVGTGTGDVTLVLRINGADSAITFTLSDTGSAQTKLQNDVLTASVSAGDLVGWRMQQATSVNFGCALQWGFLPS